VRPAVQVLEGRVVRGDEAGAGAALDAHVADGHPLFHGQATDRVAGVFEDVAGPATDPDPRDQREDDVLGADARGEPSVDPDLVRLRVALEEGLGGEDHLDLARPDPEREGAERAVRARVGVAAHDRHAGLGQAQLGPDDMDDALSRVADPVQRDPEFGAVGLELVDLGRRHLIEERQAAVGRRDRMVSGSDGLARSADADPSGTQPGERLRAGDFVDQMEVDGEDGGSARILGHDVVGPDLVDDGAGGLSAHLPSVPEGPDEGAGRGRSGPKAASQCQRRPATGPGRWVSTCGMAALLAGVAPVNSTSGRRRARGPWSPAARQPR
jgi:hypothetical protein